MTEIAPQESCAPRRHAAGENPAKRDQILNGAARVFMEKGFDAASMNDICKAAGVSKGTLYVYFADKVELFEAMIEAKREGLFGGMRALLETDLPLDERLRQFGARLARVLCSDAVIRAQRVTIGTVEKMPEVGRRFYDAGPRKIQDQLRRFLEAEVAAGNLSVPDPSLAAMQFIELSTGSLWRPRLFAVAEEPPTQDEIDHTVASAVAMFLAAHGKTPAA